MDSRLKKPAVIAAIVVALLLGLLLGISTGIADRIFGGPNPKTIATAFPSAVRFSPRVSDSIVFMPRQPSSACTTKTVSAVQTMFQSEAGLIHFQPMSINWS